MRRFLIWSAVAALIGLILAGVGVWVYWTFIGRYQTVVVGRHETEVQRMLDASSWVADGATGPAVYVIGYRDSPELARWTRAEAPRLRQAGADVRYLMFARPDRQGMAQSTPAERATVAELWLTRDWALFQRWTATPSRQWTAAGLPSADRDLAREAVVEAGRDFVSDLTERLGLPGGRSRYPLILWRDRSGALKACACAEPRGWATVRRDLIVAAPPPPRIETPAEPVEAPPPAAAPPPPASNALPYPQLRTPSEDAPVDATPAPETPPSRATAPPTRVMPRPTQPAVRPARPTTERPAARPPARQAQPSRPPANRRPPEAKRDEDSTFF